MEQVNLADVFGDNLPQPAKVVGTYKEVPASSQIRRAIQTKRPLMLSGPSGSGKSFVIEQEIRKWGRGYYVMSCAEGLRMADFTARQELSPDGGSSWKLGALPLSMKHGLPIILDEIDSIAQELAQILLRALEYREILIPQTGETIVAHKDWVVFATSNTLRDQTGGYAGTRPSTALLNRFQFAACDYLDTEEEIAIYESIGLKKDDAEKIALWLKAIRPLYEQRKVSMAPSVRIGVNMAREILGLDNDGNKVTVPLPMSNKDAWNAVKEMCFINALPEREIKHMRDQKLV